MASRTTKFIFLIFNLLFIYQKTVISCECSCRDRAGELSACVENANMANRLVHLHLDRERSAADSLAAAATGKSETGKGDERKCAVKFDLGDDSDDDDLEVGPDRTKGDKSRESISMGFDGGDGSISDGSLLKKGARCDIDRADRARDCGWNDASDDRDGSHNAEQSPGCGCSSSSSNWLPTDDRTTVASSGDANKWNGMTDNNNEDCYFGSVATIDCKTCQLYIAVDKDSGKGDSCSNDLCCHLNFHTCHATEP